MTDDLTPMREAAFWQTELGKLFAAFEAAHQRSAVAPYDEKISDRKLTQLWAQLRATRAALISALLDCK